MLNLERSLRRAHLRKMKRHYTHRAERGKTAARLKAGETRNGHRPINKRIPIIKGTVKRRLFVNFQADPFAAR